MTILPVANPMILCTCLVVVFLDVVTRRILPWIDEHWSTGLKDLILKASKQPRLPPHHLGHITGKMSFTRVGDREEMQLPVIEMHHLKSICDLTQEDPECEVCLREVPLARAKYFGFGLHPFYPPGADQPNADTPFELQMVFDVYGYPDPILKAHGKWCMIVCPSCLDWLRKECGVHIKWVYGFESVFVFERKIEKPNRVGQVLRRRFFSVTQKLVRMW